MLVLFSSRKLSNKIVAFFLTLPKARVNLLSHPATLEELP